MDLPPPRVVIVMPAYNAEKTLAQTVRDIPDGVAQHLILVDDASRDRTVAAAEGLGLTVFRHAKNRGYGGNQKTCYDEALKAGADIVVLLHPDHQYDPTLIPRLLEPLLNGEADAVFGSRMLGGGFFEGGMPLWKFYGNVVLTTLGNLTLRTYLTEFHSGFRAYSRHFLETVPYPANSDDFVFDTQTIVQGTAFGLKIREVPINTRYFDDASQIRLPASCRYALQILWVLGQYQWFRWGLFTPAFLKLRKDPEQ